MCLSSLYSRSKGGQLASRKRDFSKEEAPLFQQKMGILGSRVQNRSVCSRFQYAGSALLMRELKFVDHILQILVRYLSDAVVSPLCE